MYKETVVAFLRGTVRNFRNLEKEESVREILVLPIFALLGWNVQDINEVKRGPNGGKKAGFDLLLFSTPQGKARILVEIKSLTSSQFKMPGKEEHGKLALENNVWKQAKTDDGLAQLRRYCLDPKHGRDFDTDSTILVFTNGETWMGFVGKEFVKKPEEAVNLSSLLFGPVKINAQDFWDTLTQNLQK